MGIFRDAVANGSRSTSPSHITPLEGIDTRLVAAVQMRAGARVHEAAGLLQQYYLWANLLAKAERIHDESKLKRASLQVSAAKSRLRKFLLRPALAVA